jgi:hypothetical protein
MWVGRNRIHVIERSEILVPIGIQDAAISVQQVSVVCLRVGAGFVGVLVESPTAAV